MRELVFEVFGTEDRDFAEEELAFDGARSSVVEDGPDGYLCGFLALCMHVRVGTHQIFQLSSRLLDDAVLPSQHDAHPRQILDFGSADDERVDAARC